MSDLYQQILRLLVAIESLDPFYFRVMVIIVELDP